MISIIICSVNPVLFARIHAHYAQLLGSEPSEIIGIHNAKGLCEGYNRGLAQCRGDIVIFSHDDIEIWTPEFTARLKRHMENFDVLGVAGTTKLVGPGWHSAGRPFTCGQVTHPCVGEFQVSYFGAHRRVVESVQALDGLFLAFRRDVILKVGWDAENFDGYHCYDVDCSYRAYRMGFRLGVALDLPMMHQSGGSFDQTWQQYAERFMRKHGAHLETLPPRSFQVSAVQVKTREEARALMEIYYQRLPE